MMHGQQNIKFIVVKFVTFAKAFYYRIYCDVTKT
jgi:hypothetical protein